MDFKELLEIYQICLDETCWFLAIDFDDEGWIKDVTTLREVSSEFKIPTVVVWSWLGKVTHI